ncbi:hypothetical protein EV1_025889 [Malus domestica]
MSVTGSNEVEGPISGNISDSGEAAPASEDSIDYGEATSAAMSSTEAPISGKISYSERELPPIYGKMLNLWKQEEIPNRDDYVPSLIDNTELVQALLKKLRIGDPTLLDFLYMNIALPSTAAATKPSSSSSESPADNVELGKGKIDEKGNGKEKQEDGEDKGKEKKEDALTLMVTSPHGDDQHASSSVGQGVSVGVTTHL